MESISGIRLVKRMANMDRSLKEMELSSWHPKQEFSSPPMRSSGIKYNGQGTVIFDPASKRFVVFADVFATLEILASSDGITWTNINNLLPIFIITTPPLLLRDETRNVLLVDGGYIAISPSDDLSAFTSTSHFTTEPMLWTVPKIKGGYFAAGAFNGWTSSDGKEWSRVPYSQDSQDIGSSTLGINTNFGIYAALTSVTDESDNSHVTGVIVSSDGSHWEKSLDVSKLNLPYLMPNALATNDSGIFVFSENSTSFQSYVVYSHGNSGIWKIISNVQMTSVQSVGGTLVGLDSAGKMFISEDGISWKFLFSPQLNSGLFNLIFNSQVVILPSNILSGAYVGDVKNLGAPWEHIQLEPKNTFDASMWFVVDDVIYAITPDGQTQQWWTSSKDGKTWSTPRSMDAGGLQMLMGQSTSNVVPASGPGGDVMVGFGGLIVKFRS
eukprot:TRINITY_DN1170_c0_g2_i3.p1 TRINITY_DN1170_c0_g2~~TRINITY_DN1170_c0_g2_i3.p1  ORF type:complete len:440 (-),score=141.26 TRINITY_DN1170_c0_g2_i3:50-1369(-)